MAKKKSRPGDAASTSPGDAYGPLVRSPLVLGAVIVASIALLVAYSTGGFSSDASATPEANAVRELSDPRVL